MGIKRDIYWRIAFSFIVMVVFALAILWKIFQIQNVEGNYWRAMADSLTTRFVAIPADRGNIYSSDNRLLATSLPRFEIRFDAIAEGLENDYFNSQIVKLSDSLAWLFQDKNSIDYRFELTNARKNNERYHLLKREISYTQLQKIKNFPIFRDGQYKGGLIVTQKNKRAYPFRVLANRTIGYVRDNGTKPVGLEAKFNKDLNGTQGKRLMQKISGGVWMPVNDDNELAPKNGKDIITTLDVSIQDVAENALLKTLLKHNAHHGCVVVMEVKTGAIKAIANLGIDKYDSTYKELFNYAIGEAHEPGSTFKLASMLALLEDGYIKLSDTVDTEHGHKIYGKQNMKDAEDHGESRVTIKKCFAISSNVGVSKLVYQNYVKNPDKYLTHLRNLQLDQLVGIEIPGEQKPYLKNINDKYWNKTVSLPWMAVGYELNITPLRLLTLYNAVANNGVMMKPFIVQSIQEYGEPTKEFSPIIINQKICSDATLASLQELLKDVVIEGTAHNLMNPYYSIAGKTGTAQITNIGGGYVNHIYQSSFYGYFPAVNPIYSIAVVINNPSNGIYYGSAVAGPVFKEIADNIFSTNLEMHPTMEKDTTTYKATLPIVKNGYSSDLKYLFSNLGIPFINDEEGTWLQQIANEKLVELTSSNKTVIAGVVPDVKGMGLRDAIYLLESSGLQVKVEGIGMVKNQSLPAGTKILKGQFITLMLNT
ncbi:MAG: PASTA domain-containing protein [Sphingobacteriales bacterium]|nr:MAG: PASTA domain-containing protein [Sphingobacteriales bacterium]